MPYSLFIADLHLDVRRPALIEAFEAFLRTEARGAEVLYILGDLFEVWIGDDNRAEGLHGALAALQALTQKGTPVRFLHGNRDFLVGSTFARRTGVELMPQRQVIDLYGTPTLVEHGDLLCTDDVAYQRYRRRIRHPLSLLALRILPRFIRERMARDLRELSAQEMAGKSTEIMDVNAETVRQVMREAEVRQLIHGHTHRPNVHRFELDGAPAVRVVLGDWYEQESWLVADSEGLHVVSQRT